MEYLLFFRNIPLKYLEVSMQLTDASVQIIANLGELMFPLAYRRVVCNTKFETRAFRS